VKDFLLQRFADESGALGSTSLSTRTQRLTRPQDAVPRAAGARVRDPAYGCHAGESVCAAPRPDLKARTTFRETALAALRTLPAPALARHFRAFCDGLDEAAPAATDAGTLMTAARRIYERSAATDYLELPVSAQSRSPAFRRFAAALLTDAARFRDVYNAELASYRSRTGTRSLAQPVPNLGGPMTASSARSGCSTMRGGRR